MHHVLRFYSAHQELILRLYMLAARFTMLPVIGKPVKALMQWYALSQHKVWVLTSEEAKDIIDQCKRSGLIQSLVKCRNEAYAICNCCLCCCIPLRFSRVYGIHGSISRDSSVVNDRIFRLQERPS